MRLIAATPAHPRRSPRRVVLAAQEANVALGHLEDRQAAVVHASQQEERPSVQRGQRSARVGSDCAAADRVKTNRMTEPRFFARYLCMQLNDRTSSAGSRRPCLPAQQLAQASMLLSIQPGRRHIAARKTSQSARACHVLESCACLFQFAGDPSWVECLSHATRRVCGVDMVLTP